MSDSLKDRLSSHSNSFEGLLSLIPARYYYDDESNSQWQRKGAHKRAERKNEAIQAKQNKFDPDHGTSALDEVKRRESAAREADAETEVREAEDDVVIYDDHGNPIGERELSVAELLQLKAKEANQDGQENGKKELKKEPKRELKKEPKKESKKEPRQKVENGAEGSAKGAADGVNADEKPRPKGIEELRAKLAARVTELREIRKAPGSNAVGAPKSREELLAARKQRLEQKKKVKKAADPKVEHKEDDEPEDDEPEDDEPEDEPEEGDDSHLMFGQIQFGDGAKLGKSGTDIEQQRAPKKRNAVDQLRVLENRKAKMSKLDKEKQNEIAENAKWSRAILQTEGAKVRDDEKLLSRTVKKQQNKKRKSEREWKQRLFNVKKGISDREAKRNTNLRAHKEAKKLGLKGKKRKDYMKKAGAK